MDLEKAVDDEQSSKHLKTLGPLLTQTNTRFCAVTSSESTSSSATIVLRPKPFDVKPNRDVLPKKTGTRFSRYLLCKPIISLLFRICRITPSTSQFLFDISKDFYGHLYGQSGDIRSMCGEE